MSDYWAWQDYWLRDDEYCSCCNPKPPKTRAVKPPAPIECGKCKQPLKKEEHASNMLCDKCFFEK